MAIQGNGSSGWKVTGLNRTTGSEPAYTLFCWAQVAASPGADITTVSWGGASGTHTNINVIAASSQWWGYDQDSAFANMVAVLVDPGFAGTWEPLLLAKASLTAITLYLNTFGNSAPVTGTVASQTLTDLYIAQDESSSHYMASNQGVAEVAVYNGALGTSDITSLLGGACALAVNRANLIAYFPLKTDLIDRGPSNLTLTGVAPTFIAHPPVADYTNYLISAWPAPVVSF